DHCGIVARGSSPPWFGSLWFLGAGGLKDPQRHEGLKCCSRAQNQGAIGGCSEVSQTGAKAIKRTFSVPCCGGSYEAILAGNDRLRRIRLQEVDSIYPENSPQ